jgi:hypothetical protein
LYDLFIPIVIGISAGQIIESLLEFIAAGTEAELG